jgi:hypothetical protein
MRYHGEFSLVRHDLILDFDLFTSRFKGTMRREDCALQFSCYGKILLGGGIAQSSDIIVSSCVFCLFLYLIIIYLWVV